MMYSSEEDIFTTPPTSPYTSVFSLTSRQETVYESAVDLTQFSDDYQSSDFHEEQHTLDDDYNLQNNSDETQKLVENISYKQKRERDTNSNSLVIAELHEDHLTENKGHQIESPNDVDVAIEPLLDVDMGILHDTTHTVDDSRCNQLDGLTKQEQNCICVTAMNDIHERINQTCINMSEYVPSAMSITTNPCTVEGNLKPEEIINWLQNKRGNLNITDFLKINFDKTLGEVNIFQHLQSRIFMLFFLFLLDASRLFCEAFVDKDKTISSTIQEDFKTWIRETELIFEVLLHTSYINIKICKVNTNSLEQPLVVLRNIIIDNSAEYVGFHKSLKEMKLLRKQMAGIPRRTEKMFICVSVIMFVVDMATDIVQTLTYYNEGNTLWPLIATFIVIPSLIASVVCFAAWQRDHPTTKKELRLKRLGVVLIPLQLGKIWQEVCRLFDRYFIMDSYSALSLLLVQMLEGLFEGGPQALIQTYVLFGQNINTFSFQNVIHVASPLLSSVSMAHAITNIDFGRLSMTVSFKTKVSFILCRLGEVWARFIVYVAIFYSFGIYGLILVCAQVIMLMIPTFFLIRRDHKQRQSRDINCVYLRCRHGGFYAITPTRVFKSKPVRWFVWFSIPFLYSLVPLQRFEIDFEYNGFSSKRPPFWKCSRHFAMFNTIYIMHHIFNIVGFMIWCVAGRIADTDFFIPLCVLFAAGTCVSIVIRIQSWVGRTYHTSFQNNITENKYQRHTFKTRI